MPTFNVPDLNPSKIQALLDADPLYRQHLAAFQSADPRGKPSASLALMNDFNRLVPYEQRLNSRYKAAIGEDGRVAVHDQNNPWTDPGLWGPIAVGAATAGVGLWAGGFGGGGATVPAAAGSQYVVDGVAGFGGTGAAAAGAAGGAAPAAAAAGGSGMWGSVINGAFSLFSNLWGANKTADANTEAARIQAEAALKAAGIADEATKRAEAFQRRQAENLYQNTEAGRRGTYDQWAAAQRRLGTVGSYIGMGDREIPDYVPGVDPRFTEDGTPAPGAAGPSASSSASRRAPAGSVDFTLPPDQLGPALTQYFTQNGVSPHEVPFWVEKAGELVARGQELNDPNYAMKRLAAADVFGRQPGATTQAAKRLPRTVEDYFSGAPSTSPLLTPALRMPGPVASYL